MMRKGPESRVYGSLLTAQLSLQPRFSEQEGPSMSLLRLVLPKLRLHLSQAHWLPMAHESTSTVASQHYKPGSQSESPKVLLSCMKTCPFLTTTD